MYAGADCLEQGTHREGRRESGRDPSEINVAEYIRICVDDDEDAARIALAKATMGYALGAAVPTERERQLGYRAHFERMGSPTNLRLWTICGETEHRATRWQRLSLSKY